ncbi:hypothetical protein [Frankia sp. AgB32]|uniref:hypothetical protein n=1 Tax=Frankia sp. AgB32 TaxID=631119 RepID=UPI0020105C68|nr:hypothetical protein [Frankia sp. AgB32]MCK9898147.1 hypothetical protein [Frankia sp. AgB32]
MDLGALPLSPKQIRSISEANRRLNIWQGSVRSGKTISSLLRWLIFIADPPPSGLLVIVGKTLDTVFRNVFEPLMDPAIFGEAARHVVYTRGAPTAKILGRRIEIITGNDVRSEGKLRGATIAGMYADELTLLGEDFFTQALARLSVPGAKLFGTTNPDGPQHYIRKKFLLRQGELDLATWHFVLDDNPVLEEDYKNALKAEYVGLWYRRFILGEWCLAEGACYDMWDEDRFVEDTIPTITRWVGTGVDYGTVAPFVGIVGGIGVDRRLHLVAEYRYESKLAHRQKTDAEYSTALQEFHAGVPIPGTGLRGVRPEYICVDPSAASFVTQLYRDGVSGVMNADNSVVDGIRMVSSLFGNDRIRVHRSVRGFISEVPGYAWDSDAADKGIDQPIKADDHSCLAAGTLVTTELGDVPIEYVAPGTRVLTRDGWRPVTDAGMTDASADVLRVDLSNGRSLTGTGNHPVFVENKGWTRLDSLTRSDSIVMCPSALTSSCTAASNTAGTLTLPAYLTATTSLRESAIGKRARRLAFTKTSGVLRTARSRTAATSTIGTGTRSTTIPRTSNVSRSRSIGRTMVPRSLRRSGHPSPSLTWSVSAPSLSNGTARQRALSGIERTAGTSGKAVRQPNGPASSAVARTGRETRVTTSFAPTLASRRRAARPAWTTSGVSASSAGPASRQTSIRQGRPAPVHVVDVSALGTRQPVWNLTVDGSPEFFANGVLVHNCDAVRYLIKSTEPLWYGTLRQPLQPAA